MQTHITFPIPNSHDLKELNSRSAPTSTLTIYPGTTAFLQAANADPVHKPGERPPYARPLDPPSAPGATDWRASGVVHDFHNLLAIILSHSSIALGKLPPESSARANLERVLRASRRAVELSGALLTDLTHKPAEFAPLALNEIVIEVAESLEIVVANRATLELQLAPELAPVHANRLQIQQLIMNLILNATEAIKTTPGQILITTKRLPTTHLPHQRLDAPTPPPDEYVVLEIQDTGIGMDQPTLDRIFQPYFTTKTTGTGVGLSTCLEIVQTHNGIIQVSSTPGHGTLFRVLLPRCSNEERE
ncbi:MAG: ATP-binding protein [Caldilineaceae bacterium]